MDGAALSYSATLSSVKTVGTVWRDRGRKIVAWDVSVTPAENNVAEIGVTHSRAAQGHCTWTRRVAPRAAGGGAACLAAGNGSGPGGANREDWHEGLYGTATWRSHRRLGSDHGPRYLCSQGVFQEHDERVH